MEALKREIMEELSIQIDLSKLIFPSSYQIVRNKKKIDLNFFFLNTWVGKIKPVEKQKIKWIKLEESKNYKMLPSNKKILKLLNSFFSSMN